MKHRSLLLLWVIGWLVGCCTDPVTGKKYFCLYEVSEADEVRLGEEYAPNFIAQSGGLYPDPELQGALSRVVIDAMATRSHRPNLPWKFEILNTSQINAFALPGGRVFVTRGLIAQLESEAQFAHLMGHEIGHVCHKHSVKGQSRAQAFALLLGVISATERSLKEGDSEDPLWVSTAAGLGGQLILLKYSRDQELESDRRGVDYALLAGYDPRESVKTFELFLSLKQQAGQKENVIDGLLATHPLDSKRIAEIKGYIGTSYPGIEARNDLAVSRPQWSSLIERVRSAQRAYDRYDEALALVARARSSGNQRDLDQAENLLRQSKNEFPQHAHFHVGEGIIAVERSDSRGALRSFDRACDLDPQLFEARFNRARVRMELGNARAAVDDLRAAHDLYPYSPLPCYQLGVAFESLDDPTEAVRWYQATLERTPEASELEGRATARIATLE